MPSCRLAFLVLSRFWATGFAASQVVWGAGGHCAQLNNLASQQGQPVLDRPEAWVNAHNHYRACHGVPPLVWNDAMVPYARAWAETLIQHCDGTQDLTLWAAGSGPDEHRPHDPNSYNEIPSMGENLYSGQGMVVEPESDIVEGWYREVETECPNLGQQPGCGAELNHFTALIWKDADMLGCAVVARDTPYGAFLVADCRYASSKDLSLHHCNIPNTMNCDGRQHPEDGLQVPALVGGRCQPAEQMPVGPPPGPAGAQATGECIEKHVLGKCDPCLFSDQCGDDRYCCPFMKKCVKDGHEVCYSPIAMCAPPCLENVDPKTCGCKTPEFPCLWQKPLCGAAFPSCTVEEMTPPEKAPWEQDLGDGSSVSIRMGRFKEVVGPAAKNLTENLRTNVEPVEKRLDAALGISRKNGATPWALMAAMLFGSCVFFSMMRAMCCGYAPEQVAYQPYQQQYPPNYQPMSRPMY